MTWGAGAEGGEGGSRPRGLAAWRGRLANRLALGIHSKTVAIGLRRDLGLPREPPPARIPVSLRPWAEADLSTLFPEDGGAASGAARADTLWRLGAVARGILRSHCFVLVDGRSGLPCHVQWLTEPGYGDAIRRAGALPVLAADEGLIENAYTPESHRGLGLMAVAMDLIAGRAAAMGMRYLLVYIDADNPASLTGAERAGLVPWSRRTSRQWGFGLVRHVGFARLAGTGSAGRGKDEPR